MKWFVWTTLALCVSSPVGCLDTIDRSVPPRQGHDLGWRDGAGSHAPPSASWTVSLGGAGPDMLHGLQVDASGGVYITGDVTGAASFGNLRRTGFGKPDMFAARLDSQGKFVWAVLAGGAGVDSGNGLALDGSSNSYIVGQMEGSATFGKAALTSRGKQDLFVARLDSQGKFAWATQAGGAGDDIGNAIALDSAGNAYITGAFSGKATFGAASLQSAGQEDLFVAKLDRGGKFVWATRAGGPGVDTGRGIALDSAEEILLVGDFSGSAAFGARTVTSKGGRDLFAAKLDRDGKVVWATTAGGDMDDFGNNIAVDSRGGLRIVGEFSTRADFGATLLTSKGNKDAFVARLDRDGKFIWATAAGGQAFDAGFSVTLDAHDNSFVSGNFMNRVSFGPYSRESSGGEDLFVARLDREGAFQWVITAGGPGLDFGARIALGAGGDIYFGGEFSSTAKFDATSLVSLGAEDGFVARRGTNGK